MQLELTYEQLTKQINSEKKIFVVSGKSFEFSGIAQKLKIEKCKIVRFSEFTENPKLDEVVLGVAQFKKSGAKHILAVGGGTAIDIAKLIKHYSQTLIDSSALVPPEAAFLEEVNGILLSVIPTTFGSGSEATHFAVMYIKGTKFSISGTSLYPNQYLLDCNLASTLPCKVKASTSLDALCQAIESYWSKGASIQSRELSAKAIPMIVRNYFEYVSQSGSTSYEIALASHFAGKAINLTKTTAPHALSYFLTKNYGLAHGHAVALIMIKFFKFHSRLKSNENLANDMNSLYKLMSCSNCPEAEELLVNMLRAGGLETSLEDLGIKSISSIEKIIKSVNVERLNNHPFEVDDRILGEVLK